MISEIGEDDKKFLMKVAKDTLISKFLNEDLPSFYRFKKFYQEKFPIFIKLKINDNIRGYIGILVPKKDLIETIQDLVIKTAFDDLRFEPLKKDEFENLKIEIFIIKNISPLKNIESFKIETDGLFIKSENATSIFFPGDLGTFDLNKSEYIKFALLKSGIPENSKNIEYYIVEFIKIE